MTFQTLENIRLFVGQKVRQDRIAAENSLRNGYKEIAAKHNNEAIFGEQILKDLSREVSEVRNSI